MGRINGLIKFHVQVYAKMFVEMKIRVYDETNDKFINWFIVFYYPFGLSLKIWISESDIAANAMRHGSGHTGKLP